MERRQSLGSQKRGWGMWGVLVEEGRACDQGGRGTLEKEMLPEEAFARGEGMSGSPGFRACTTCSASGEGLLVKGANLTLPLEPSEPQQVQAEVGVPGGRALPGPDLHAPLPRLQPVSSVSVGPGPGPRTPHAPILWTENRHLVLAAPTFTPSPTCVLG